MTLLEKYPLKTHEVLHFPLMFPDSLKAYHGPSLKYPSLDILYDFADACRVSKGAVRTALSRMKKEGLIIVQEERGVSRYRSGNLQMEAMMNFQKRSRRTKGYTLAVYSFDGEMSKERNTARELLEYMGFVRFAQNSWMAFEVKTGELSKSLRANGLDEHVYLFDVHTIEDTTMKRIVSFWNLDERAARLQNFYEELKVLLHEPGSDRDAFVRLGIAWVTFIIHIHGTEPPVPENLLPGGYRYNDIVALLKKMSMRYGPRMYRYWKNAN